MPTDQQSYQLQKIEFTKWAYIGLANFFNTNPEIFLSRLAKGPPPQYRWLVWSFVAAKHCPKKPNQYSTALEQGRHPDNPCFNDISKDMSRTFPDELYFKNDAYGSYGQAKLTNILQAYSIVREDVGYCQSMNFLAGFLLMISGGQEKESYLVF